MAGDNIRRSSSMGVMRRKANPKFTGSLRDEERSRRCYSFGPEAAAAVREHAAEESDITDNRYESLVRRWIEMSRMYFARGGGLELS